MNPPKLEAAAEATAPLRTIAPVGSKEIHGLDLLRFLAAFFVMAFHLAWGSWRDMRGASALHTSLEQSFAPFFPLASGGWIGVQIFFVISGFVITYSASGASAADFAQKRFLRLFPGIAICASLGALALLADGYPGDEVLKKYLYSLAFVPTGPWIANSYWTLTVEIVFYAALFGLIFTNTLGRIELFSEFLLLISLVFWLMYFALSGPAGQAPWLFSMNKFTQRILLQHGSFFSLGITLWLGFQFRWNVRRFLSAVLAVVVSFAAILGEVGHTNDWFKVQTNPAVPLVAWSLAMGFFCLSVVCNDRLGAWMGAKAGWLRVIGRATYPLYLLHQPIGEAIIQALVRLGIAPFVALAVAAVCNLVLAIAVASLFEPRLRRGLKQFLDQRSPGAGLAALHAVRNPIRD